MSILSRAFGQHAAGLPAWATIDEEALRLAAGLEHIDRHGNLDDFSETQSGKLALMATARRRGLLTWNRDASRYELTSLGRQHLGASGRANPVRTEASASRAGVQLGSPFSPGALIASAACVVLGVAVMAATLRFFDVEPQNPAAMPKIASRQDVPARIGAQPPADPAAAPARDSNRAEPPTASPSPTPHGTPAQLAESTAAGHAFASSQSASANPQPSSRAALPSGVPAQAAKESAPTRSALSDHLEGTVPIPSSDPRRAVATSEAIEGPGRDAPSDVRETPETPRVKKSQPTVQRLSRAEAPSQERRNATPGQTHGWASGKTVDVVRTGLLVREERALPDGTVVVRYQYGNGPAHFETRPKGGRDRAPGYAQHAGEHVTRLGRFNWLR